MARRPGSSATRARYCSEPRATLMVEREELYAVSTQALPCLRNCRPLTLRVSDARSFSATVSAVSLFGAIAILAPAVGDEGSDAFRPLSRRASFAAVLLLQREPEQEYPDPPQRASLALER